MSLSRPRLDAFMRDFVAAIRAHLPVGMDAAAVGDWIVVTNRTGIFCYATAADVDDDSSIGTLAQRVFGTLTVVQEAAVRHLAEPWPEAGTGRHVPSIEVESGPTFLDAYFQVGTFEGADWHGRRVLELPRLRW